MKFKPVYPKKITDLLARELTNKNVIQTYMNEKKDNCKQFQHVFVDFFIIRCEEFLVTLAISNRCTWFFSNRFLYIQEYGFAVLAWARMVVPRRTSSDEGFSLVYFVF